MVLPKKSRGHRPNRHPRYRSVGRERFKQASSYEVKREWLRYEGTPQRELLRRIREQFITGSLDRCMGSDCYFAEIGPGPGRFTPLLMKRAGRVAVLDVSMTMLRACRQRILREHHGLLPEMAYVLGDAEMPPLRPGSLDAVVAIGNVIGFSEEAGEAVLRSLAASVAPGGLLLLETVSPVTTVPKFLGISKPWSWRELLSLDPAVAVSKVVESGFEPFVASPSSKEVRSKFYHVDPAHLKDKLVHYGFKVDEQLVVAPLTGGDPERVEVLSTLRPDALDRLIRFERAAGHDRRLLRCGGHTLTCATLA